MQAIRPLYKLTLTEIKLYLREPAAVFFTLAFPLMVLLLFGSIFGDYPIPGTNLKSIDLQAPSYTGLIIGSVGLIGLPSTIASYRERGVLRRLRATPIGATSVLGSHVIVNLLMTLLGAFLLFVVAWLALGMKPPEAPVLVVLALALASFSFLAVGFALAGLLSTQRVTLAVGQIIFFPMFFLSGAALPLEQMPDSVRRVSDFLPLTYAVKLVQGLWIGEGCDWLAVGVLAGLLVLAVAVSARTFRWE